MLSFCDNASATAIVSLGVPAGTTLLADNVDTANSTFSLSNPSGSGTIQTVVSIHIESPNLNVDTEVALGASPKR